MILYFSGTGNSAYAAKQIAAQTGDIAINLLEKFKTGDHSPMESARPWVIVAPVYAWQLPQIVSDWIRQTDFLGSQDFYFVITCGDNIGNAAKYLKELCAKKYFNYKGCAKIVMPENFVPMFKAPGPEEALKIVDASEPVIRTVSDAIFKEQDLPEVPVGLLGGFLSGPVNKGFNAATNCAKKYHVDDSCIGCGQCARLCPTNNVNLSRSIPPKPLWGTSCINCMACICLCPVNAIVYGHKGKMRYECPKDYK